MKMKETARFKKEFIEKLKVKIPSKVLELDLDFPKEQKGGIRLEHNAKGEFEIVAIYLTGLGKKCNPIDPYWPILKFQFKDYLFQGVYIRKGDEEIRYDSEMNVDSKYIGHESQRRIGNVIPNAVHKVEYKGKRIKPTNYNVFLDHKPPLPDNFSYKEIEKITENYNAKEKGIWICKGHIKDNIIYLELK